MQPNILPEINCEKPKNPAFSSMLECTLYSVEHYTDEKRNNLNSVDFWTSISGFRKLPASFTRMNSGKDFVEKKIQSVVSSGAVCTDSQQTT